MQINTIHDYAQLAKVTLNSDLSQIERLQMLKMGIIGETGEIIDYLKKCKFHGHPISLEKVVDEAGDVMWYVALLLDEFDKRLPFPITSSIFEFDNFEGFCSWVTSVNRCSHYFDECIDKRSGDLILILSYEITGLICGLVDGVAGYLGTESVALRHVLEKNIEKLAKRYPEGFSELASIHREG